MADETIGLIGAGLLGSALAERFMESGFGVLGFDSNPERLTALERAGGAVAVSAADVAGQCERIVLSLPDSRVASTVIGHIEAEFAPGRIVIDTTTGDPDAGKALGARLAAMGVAYVDATIGGSSRQARLGEAIVMVGASMEAFARCADLFASLGGRTFHVGPPGSGGRMKLVMNLVLGLNRAVLAEGLAFAKASGVSPSDALEVLRAGPAYSRAMDVKGPRMLSGDFVLEARLSQHLKDVRLILETAVRVGASTPLSEAHRLLLEKAEAAGFGGADNSAVIKAYD